MLWFGTLMALSSGMNSWKKIANRCHEEVSRYTTCSFSKHGLSDSIAKVKRIINRRGKRLDAKWHRGSQLS